MTDSIVGLAKVIDVGIMLRSNQSLGFRSTMRQGKSKGRPGNTLHRSLLHLLLKHWGKTGRDNSERINDRNDTFWRYAAARVFKLSQVSSAL